MRLTVEFLSLPNAAKIVGGKTTPFEFPGGTVAELLAALARTHGEPFRRALLDADGALDLAIQVQINEDGILRRDGLDRPLADGDRVRFLMLVGGG